MGGIEFHSEIYYFSYCVEMKTVLSGAVLKGLLCSLFNDIINIFFYLFKNRKGYFQNIIEI